MGLKVGAVNSGRDNPNKILSPGVVAKYYKIEQDYEVKNAPEILNLANAFFNKRELPKNVNVLFVKERTNVEINYPAYIDRPVLLVSDIFKKVISMYHKDYVCQTVVLTEQSSGNQNVYWHIRVPEVDCLSAKSVIGHDQLVKKAVIDEAKAQDRSFIKISNNIQSIYVVRLDLLESALRRDLCGFTLEELESE